VCATVRRACVHRGEHQTQRELVTWCGRESPPTSARGRGAAARCGRRRFTRDCLRPTGRRARVHTHAVIFERFSSSSPPPVATSFKALSRPGLVRTDGGGQEAGVTCAPSLCRVRRVITGFVYVASAKWVTSFHDRDNAPRRAATSNAHKRRFVPPKFRASASVLERACGAPRSGVSGLCRIGLYNGDRTPAFNEHCVCQRHNYRPRNPVL